MRPACPAKLDPSLALKTEVAVAWQLNTRARKTLARNSRLGLKGISELLLNRTFKATELEIFPGHFVTKR